MVNVNNDDEPDEQQPSDAEGANEKPRGRRSLAPQLEAILAQQQRSTDLISPRMAIFEDLTARHRLFEAAETQQRLAESIQRHISPRLAALQEIARSVVLPLVKLPALNLNLPPNWYPPNWQDVPDLDTDAGIDTAVAIMQEEGIPLVWVPRADIVASLIRAADAGARDSVLLASRDDIPDDCLGVIGEVTDAELKPLAALGAGAIAALRAGHSSSAQALAVNVFDTLLRDACRRGVIFAGSPAGYFRYPKVRKQITPVSDDTLIRRFRADCALAPAIPALQDYDPSDPPPARFVRHATAHRAGPEQYTPANAIVAVMFMGSMLREAQAAGW